MLDRPRIPDRTAIGKPNLLFVFPDQWRKQAIGIRGEDAVLTPHIDRFATQSVDLLNAISCFPLCSPNRSAMLTGRYPLSTGVTTNCKLGLPIKLRDDEVTMGNLLQMQGYRTGYIGKWHLDLPELSTNPAPVSGAVHWDSYIPPGPRRFGFDFWYAYNAYDRHMAPHYWMDSHEKIEIDEWSTKHETDVAIRFITESRDDRPFCLYLSWNPPHQPFEEVPEAYKAVYSGKSLQARPNVTGRGLEQAKRHLSDYYAAVTGTDQEFGRLMSALEEAGIAENTIVVLTSDHGETMGAHGWMEHKNIWYEESIGIPCFIRYPGVLIPRRESLLFNSVDLVPTLLGLMGMPLPDSVEGTDFSSTLRGDEGNHGIDTPSTFICHYPGDLESHGLAAEEGWEINSYGWRGVRTKRHTYVVQRNVGASNPIRFLYDLESDPYQLSPKIYDEAPGDVIGFELERKLATWLKKINDPFILY